MRFRVEHKGVIVYTVDLLDLSFGYRLIGAIRLLFNQDVTLFSDDDAEFHEGNHTYVL